jgi:hypothetical protein
LRAVEKLVRFAQQVSITPDEMISLLDSGIEMRNLLAFFASKVSGDGIDGSATDASIFFE